MNKSGPIIIIEDDQDDQEIIGEIFEKLGYENKVIFFKDGNDTLEFLNRTDVHPFLILSDINMPVIDGFELRNKIYTNEMLQTICIPYLFFTTSSNRKEVERAYGLSVQGFFVKPNSVRELENTLKKVMDYWIECIAPSHYERN